MNRDRLLRLARAGDPDARSKLCTHASRWRAAPQPNTDLKRALHNRQTHLEALDTYRTNTGDGHGHGFLFGYTGTQPLRGFRPGEVRLYPTEDGYGFGEGYGDFWGDGETDGTKGFEGDGYGPERWAP